jgi:activator of 2-hydroxyglutaryl-CoA dehydratase
MRLYFFKSKETVIDTSGQDKKVRLLMTKDENVFF